MCFLFMCFFCRLTLREAASKSACDWNCQCSQPAAHGPRAVLQVDPRLQPIVCVRRPLFFVFASMAWRWTRRRDASQVLRRRDGFGRRVHGAAPRVGGRGPTPRRARRDFWFRVFTGGARADPGRPVRREDRLRDWCLSCFVVYVSSVRC